MPNWDAKYSGHEIHKQIPLIENVIDAAMGKAPDVDDSEDLLRIKKAIDFLKVKLASIDPLLISTATLNSLNSNLKDIIPSLNGYAANKAKPSLVQACAIVDTVLLHVSALPSVTAAKELELVGESVSGFYKSVAEYKNLVGDTLVKFSEQIKSIESSMKVVNTEINQQKTRLDAAIAEYQKQFSLSESERRRQNSEAESKREAVYLEKVAALTQGNAANLETQKKQFNDALESAKSKLLAHDEKFKKDISETISVMEQHKKHAENLITVITNTGMIGGYQKIANRAEHMTWFWNATAVLSLIGLIVFSVMSYLHVNETVIVVPKMLAKLFVAVTCGLLAAYAAREVDKYGQIERHNRKMELELASIDPYLINFDKTKREQIKETIAHKVFGQASSIDIKHPEKFSGNAMDTLKLAISTIHDIAQKLK